MMPSGCHLRRIALPPADQPALSDRPSASDYPEEQLTITPDEMRVEPHQCSNPTGVPAVGPGWPRNMTMDTSSLMSSERDETDDEIVSFDLGPLTSQMTQTDYHQTNGSMITQGLHPGSSEPHYAPFESYKAMPNQKSIMDMMLQTWKLV